MPDVQPPEGLRMVAYRAARDWATTHFHQQPDDRMVDAALVALFEACEVRAELGIHWDGDDLIEWGYSADDVREELGREATYPDARPASVHRHFLIKTPGEPVSSTGEEPTDG